MIIGGVYELGPEGTSDNTARMEVDVRNLYESWLDCSAETRIVCIISKFREMRMTTLQDPRYSVTRWVHIWSTAGIKQPTSPRRGRSNCFVQGMPLPASGGSLSHYHYALHRQIRGLYGEHRVVLRGWTDEKPLPNGAAQLEIGRRGRIRILGS